MKSLEQERDMLIASNKSLAEFNLSREPIYRQARQTLLNSHSETKKIKEETERKKSKLNELTRQSSLDTTLALMQTAAAEAEEESENFASAFLSNEVSLDLFLKDFIAKRKLAHTRRIKGEKMNEMMSKSGSNDISIGGQSMFQPVRPAPAPPPQLPFAMNPGVPPVAGGLNSNPPYPTWPPPMPSNVNQMQPNYPFNMPAYR